MGSASRRSPLNLATNEKCEGGCCPSWWRSQGEHHNIQGQGRNGIFSDYPCAYAKSRPTAALRRGCA